MKIIFKIARAELRTLFYSPIAWFVIFLFYVITAAVFSFGLEDASNFQELFRELQPDWQGFLGIGSILAGGMTTKLMGYIYLFIPLLTMGIINREISNGTIKLLYSSPVTTREIVFGKYLGLVIFNMLLVLIFALMLTSIYFVVENGEFKWYLSVLLGTFLLINTYAAIGLFISCLTTYQIVAAMITFTVFFVLSVIGGLWQQYDLVRDLTFALSINGKADRMLNGLITSRDIIYFLIIIMLFIGFALIKLQSTQESGRKKITIGKYILLTMLVVLIGYISSRPGYIAYFDLTKNKLNTVHPAVQEAIAELDGSPVTVTLYTNLLEKYAFAGLPQSRNWYIWGVWEQYIRFYPNLQFKYEYYYDTMDGDSSLYYEYPGKSLEEIVAIEAEIKGIRPSIFKKPETIKKQIDLSPEGKRLIMQLEYNGKKEWLRTYSDATVWPEQHHVAAVFKRLTRKEAVKIQFATGHYERDPFDHAGRNYGFLITGKGRHTLLNNGVDADTVSLAARDIPAKTNLLVVADPRSAYNEAELQKMSDYIDKGGNAIFYLEPGKEKILEPVLKQLGVHPVAGTIVQPNAHEMPHIFYAPMTRAGNYLAKEPAMVDFQQYRFPGVKVQHEGTLHLEYEAKNDFSIEPVITKEGDEKAWIENGILVVDSAAPIFNASEGDLRKKEYVTALKLTRRVGSKEQRLIVTGDADFISPTRITESQINSALYSWGLDNKYPIYCNYPMAPDKYVKITHAQSKFLMIIYMYVASGALLLAAIVLLVRRKRK